MLTSLIPRIAGDDEPPDASRHRVVRRRVGALLALASALAMGLALMTAPQSAQAVTSIDGQWTVVHGGTGQISLNSDGTYISTCQVFPNYEDAWCPAPSGTFQYSTYSTASVTFTGTDGSTTSYRVSGLVSSPDTITSVFGSRTYSPLVMKPGTNFTCTEWSGTGTSFTRWGISPEVEYDAASDLLYATGSHDLIGPKNIDTQVNLAETAPNYFQNGTCDSTPTPTPSPTPVVHHIGDLDNATTVASSKSQWQPQVTATVLDEAGLAVSGATVSGTFTDHAGTVTCVTSADGTCTLGNFFLKSRTKSTVFTVTNVVRESSSYAPAANTDPDGDSDGTTITVRHP